MLRQATSTRIPPGGISATGIWYQGLGADGGRDNPATAAQEIQNWGMVDGIVNPRFLRFQVQFDF